MAEHVRVHVDRQPLTPRPARDASLHDARPETRAPPLTGEHGTLVDLPLRVPRSREPAPERVDGVAADRHDTRLRPLPMHAHRAVTQVDVVEIEPEQLGRAAGPTNRRAP